MVLPIEINYLLLDGALLQFLIGNVMDHDHREYLPSDTDRHKGHITVSDDPIRIQKLPIEVHGSEIFPISQHQLVELFLRIAPVGLIIGAECQHIARDKLRFCILEDPLHLAVALDAYLCFFCIHLNQSDRRLVKEDSVFFFALLQDTFKRLLLCDVSKAPYPSDSLVSDSLWK